MHQSDPMHGLRSWQSIMMDGPDALAIGGNFSALRRWSDSEWQAARERIEAQNTKDRAQR